MLSNFSRNSNIWIFLQGPNRIKKSSSSLDDDNSNTEVINNSNPENNPSTTSSEQTAYELLLKQQQMFLQWQLENELEKVCTLVYVCQARYPLF